MKILITGMHVFVPKKGSFQSVYDRKHVLQWDEIYLLHLPNHPMIINNNYYPLLAELFLCRGHF